MALVHANGLAFGVEVVGQGSPLLLLHGFTGSAATWRPHLPALTPHVTAVAVDLIGHGRSSAPVSSARYTMEHCVADLIAVLDRLDLGRVSVLGYSLGARVALHIAVSAPRRVRALILESGSPGLAEAEDRRARREQDEALAERIEGDGIAAFVAAWERLPLFATQQRLPAGAREAVRRERLQHSPVGLANSLRGMGTGAQPSLWDRLGEIDVPALLITGALDEKFCAIARAMAAAMPRARHIAVLDAGHAVHLEQPDVFDQLVIDFVAEHTRHASTANAKT